MFEAASGGKHRRVFSSDGRIEEGKIENQEKRLKRKQKKARRLKSDDSVKSAAEQADEKKRKKAKKDKKKKDKEVSPHNGKDGHEFAWAVGRFIFPFELTYQVGISKAYPPAYSWLTRIDDVVLVGGIVFKNDVERLLKDENVHGVINMCEEWKGPVEEYRKYGIDHLWLPTCDPLQVSLHDLIAGVEFIEEHAAKGQSVVVHCKAGRGRSSSIAICYFVKTRGMTAEEANQFLCDIRPHVHRNLWSRSNIQEFEARYRAVPIDGSPSSSPKLHRSSMSEEDNIGGESGEGSPLMAKRYLFRRSSSASLLSSSPKKSSNALSGSHMAASTSSVPIRSSGSATFVAPPSPQLGSRSPSLSRALTHSPGIEREKNRKKDKQRKREGEWELEHQNKAAGKKARKALARRDDDWIFENESEDGSKDSQKKKKRKSKLLTILSPRKRAAQEKDRLYGDKSPSPKVKTHKTKRDSPSESHNRPSTEDESSTPPSPADSPPPVALSSSRSSTDSDSVSSTTPPQAKKRPKKPRSKKAQEVVV